ncbi:MAG: MFS transporter [Candidatus Geothermincolia bacterium]
MADTEAAVATDTSKAEPQAAAPSGIKPMHILLPLALAQLINAYDTTAMNVAVAKVVPSLHTTVSGVQTGIVIYSLVMAACMITGSKLSDIWGRKRTFLLGVILYGAGALITAFSFNLGMMVGGWSLLEGIGSALMIPAIFAMIAAFFPPGKDRLKGYAVVGSAAAAGAALGPLLCGFWATAVTWRASFLSEVAVVIVVLLLQKRLGKTQKIENKPKLDILGAVLSALGLALLVLGLVSATTFGWVHARVPLKIGGTTIIKAGGISPVIPFVIAGLVVLACFALWQNHMKKAKKLPLLNLSILKGPAAAIGLPTILILMFMQAGLLFVAPVFLQMSLGLSPLLAGVTILPLTVFLILASQLTAKLTARFSPRSLIRLGMLLIPIGIILVWLLLEDKPKALQMIPGLIVVGIGIGFANAPLLNLVQSSVSVDEQSEISGANRAFSNLGGALGTAVAGAVLMSVLIASFSGLLTQNKVVPPQEKARIQAALAQDATTVSDKQMRKYLSEKAFEPQISTALYTINQKARNKALLSALLAVGILGFIGFLFTIFLPGQEVKKKETEGAIPDDSVPRFRS